MIGWLELQQATDKALDVTSHAREQHGDDHDKAFDQMMNEIGVDPEVAYRVLQNLINNTFITTAQAIGTAFMIGVLAGMIQE